MTRIEDWQQPEQKTFAAADVAWLSQSTQNFFQPIANGSGRKEDLPWALDFGTGADLYQSAAYTGERLSARAIMADDVEQKLDAPKIQPPSDAVARPSVIRTKEDEAIWDKMQEPHKLGKHESATHIGLSPEVIAEMQKKGQASKLEFFDSAAEGALAALQKPSTEQVLLASNITPSVPNIEQKEQYQDVQSDSQTAKIAQNLEYDGRPPTLLPDPRMMQIVTESVVKAGAEAFKYGIEHPYRGRESMELAKIPEATWTQAYSAFPELASLGAEKTTQLMKAIIANELHHYDVKDTAIEGFANQLQAAGPLDGITMAVTQITVKGVRNAASELEKEVTEGKRHDNPLKKYLGMDNRQILSALHDPKEAPLLVAANLAHNARMYSRHSYPITADTLGYGFNPDLPDPTGKLEHDLMPPIKELENSPHVKNIRKWLNQLSSDE